MTRPPGDRHALSSGTRRPSHPRTFTTACRGRRLLLEPLEDRALLAALAVATNAAIFDTTSAVPHAEAANLIAELNALGHSTSSFTDLSAAGIAAALTGTDAVVIPEQEFASLNAALTAAAKDALAQYVNSGHGMIVIGSPSGRAESLMNGLFGFSLAAGPDPTAGVSFLDDVDPLGTTFVTGPIGVINFIVEVTGFDASPVATLPAGARRIYEFGSVWTVGLFTHGAGQIVYFGYDFDDPAGQVPFTANWNTVLGLAVDQVAVATPASASDVVGTSGDDTLILRRQAGEDDSQLEYSLNSAPFVPLDDVDSLPINMGAGSDLVTLDFVNGEPVPPDGLALEGGDPAAAPGDRLVLLGAGGAVEALYRPAAGGAPATIELAGDGDGIIELSGLEAIDATALAQVTLATPGPDDLVITDGTDAGGGTHAALRIAGVSGGQPIVPLFVWLVDSLVVDTTAGGGADEVSVVSAAGGHGVGNLQIDTGGENGDRVVVGATSIAGDLAINSGVVLIGGAVNVGGAIDVTSHGLLRIDAPVTAQGPITLLTTDEPGLDADLAIEAAISSGAGLVLRSADNAIVRGPLTAGTTIDIAIDTANADPGEGNTLVLLAALTAPGGTTAAGNSDGDRFEIVPQTGSTLLIVGGLPIGPQSNPQSQNATSGDVFGDKLVLDMTTAGGGQSVVGPVVVDSVGGRAVAQNTLTVNYRGIEDLDLFDGSLLTTAQQGDLYVRGTGADERIYITHDGGINPQVRVSVAGRTFPGNQGYFGPYVRGRSVIVYARGGHDLVELSSTPLRGEFHGEGGDDYLAAASFADLLIGGPGSDTLIGGSKGGHDELWGDDFDPIPQDDQSQPIANPTAAQLQQNREHWALLVSAADGPDKLSTTSGNDRLYGQGGDDQLNPGAGDDYASGGSGHDKITGGDGNDRLYGDGGNDELAGDAGSDLLSGGDGNDVLAGHRGNDVLIGGDGADNLHGQEGNDLLFAGRLALAGGDEDSTVAGDARDAALLALLLEWSTLGQATGASSAGDDGDLDWLYGYSGSDRFVGDGSSQNYDFEVGVDAVGL